MLPLLGAMAPKLLGGIFSLFGASRARSQAKKDASNKFVDLRNAAIKGGFNPLTALEATGGSGFGAYPSSAPPLASVELLTGALEAGADELSGDAGRRRSADELNNDLAVLRLDQARSGVVAYRPPSAANSMGGQPSLSGRVTPTVATTRGGFPPLGFGTAITGPRPVQVQPVSNTGGVIQIENNITGGPVYIPGDGGEPWGWDELATALLVGAPQVVANIATPLMKRRDEFLASFGLTGADAIPRVYDKLMHTPAKVPRGFEDVPDFFPDLAYQK